MFKQLHTFQPSLLVILLCRKFGSDEVMTKGKWDIEIINKGEEYYHTLTPTCACICPVPWKALFIIYSKIYQIGNWSAHTRYLRCAYTAEGNYSQV